MSSEVRVGRPSPIILAALSVVGLVVLRALQCWSLGPLLYSNEFAQLANLAADLKSGGFDPGISFRDFYRVYAYGDQAQGTLLMSLLAVPVSWALGPSTSALHSLSITAEATLVGLLALWLAKRNSIAWAMGTLVLLFPPLFVVAFQLMPYANHTEFLWLPVGLALIASTSAERARRWMLIGALSALAVFFYRLNLAAVFALVGTLMATKGRRGARSMGAALTGLVAGLVAAVIVSGRGEVAAESLLPAFSVDFSGGWAAVGRALGETWPGASSPAPWGVAAVLATGVLLVGGALATRHKEENHFIPVFGLLWFVLAFVAPIVSARPAPEYLLNAWYASVLVGLAGLASRDVLARRVSAVGAVVLVLLSAGPGLTAAIGEKPIDSYDGAALYRTLALQTLDPDDLPYWNAMAREGRGGSSAGTLTRIGECSAQFGRQLTFRPTSLTGSRCGTCSQEGVDELVRIEVEENPESDLHVLGAALWVRCNRDLAEVERTVSGLKSPSRETLLAAARAEARAQSFGAETQ